MRQSVVPFRGCRDCRCWSGFPYYMDRRLVTNRLRWDQEMLPHRLNDRERGQPVKEVDVPYRITDLPARIAATIVPGPDGCWLWIGNIEGSTGYGYVYAEGRTWGAHRYVYSLLRALDESLTLDHLCRVRHCVNPEHLDQVTIRENIMRSPIAIASINARKDHCRRGHPFDAENTYVRPSTGWRICRECARADSRKWKRRHRAKGGRS